MRYFKSLPNTSYQVPLTANLTETMNLKNLITRVRFTELTRTRTDNFYPYVADAGERPDNIANFYYGSPYRYWLVILSNSRFDMYYDYGLSERTFVRYLIKKYGDVAESNSEEDVLTYCIGTVKYYKDADGDIIDETAYGELDAADRSTVSVMDYEVSENEDKAEIRLVSNSFINQIETQFKDLMKSK